MKLLRLDQAPPGAAAGADLTDPHGRVILKAGAALTPEILARLRDWGVTHVPVAAVSEPPAEAPAPRGPGVVAELDHVFEHVVSHPVMARLKGAAAAWLKRRGTP